ncbi:hypothetical protein J437_LFUL014305 [Ladona fulva]|uniref:Nose resistant to fluoxetine protein 6 n=1 Tax=Ladona fulva TaxID=123851 RepID=A0A8K0KN93_LADFU|nr:hypothetical protein J437_LFUL014305 [Ladona fulva]
MFVVAFYATLFIKTGYGPVWNLKIGMERDRCLQNWWTNLLYVNTVVNANEMCVIQSWYVTSDMHLFVISVPVVYLLTKRPTTGKIVLSLLFIASVVVPFTVTYYQQLEPLVLGYMENLIDLAKYDTFRLSYIQTYMRGTPYFMGIALGYALHHIKKSQVKIPQVWINVITVCSFISGFLPILIASIFYQPEYQYSALTAGIYAALHRVSWGLGMCGCIILHQTLGDIFMTFIAAFIVSMLIEAPLLGIEKLIFQEAKSQEKTPSIKQNHTKQDEKI